MAIMHRFAEERPRNTTRGFGALGDPITARQDVPRGLSQPFFDLGHSATIFTLAENGTMKTEFSRRDLSLLLPAIMASSSGQIAGDTQPPALKSKGYDFAKLPARNNAAGTMKSWAVFNGVTTRGQHLVVHISELAAGQAPHPPARQAHDEVIVIREGTLEATLNGETTILGPGSVIFSGFNDLNGWKNVGTTPAQYYVISLEEHSGQ